MLLLLLTSAGAALQYLHESTRDGVEHGSCEGAWPHGWGPALTDADDVAAYSTVVSVWPADTTTVQGSGGMSSGIQQTPYAIGYIDSGHGKMVMLSRFVALSAALTRKESLLQATTTASSR